SVVFFSRPAPSFSESCAHPRLGSSPSQPASAVGHGGSTSPRSIDMAGLLDLSICCVTDLYRETNPLLGPDSPQSLLPADAGDRRGRTLVDQYTAQDLIDVTRRLAREKTPPGFRGVDLAGVLHPPESLNHGIFIQGPTGSDKSSLFDRTRLS